MAFEAPGSALGGAQIPVRVQGFDRLLDNASSYRIGRDPQADVVVSDPRVSWDHAVLRHSGSNWLLEDFGSTNGTFVNGQRVTQVAISADCSVRLGHPADGARLDCSPVGATTRDAANVTPVTARWEAGQAPAVPGQRPPGDDAPAARQLGSPSRPPSAVLPMPAKSLRIGRAPDNDVVVSDLSVSRYHAELRRTGRGEFE